jgi:hypothetical protein
MLLVESMYSWENMWKYLDTLLILVTVSLKNVEVTQVLWKPAVED